MGENTVGWGTWTFSPGGKTPLEGRIYPKFVFFRQEVF